MDVSAEEDLCLQELLERHDTALKQHDIREEAAECEAALQRTWEQRIGLQPLRIRQNIGKPLSHNARTDMTADPGSFRKANKEVIFRWRI